MQYYEKLLIEANNQKEHFSNSVESGVNMKLHEIQQKIENVNKENKELANVSKIWSGPSYNLKDPFVLLISLLEFFFF